MNTGFLLENQSIAAYPVESLIGEWDISGQGVSVRVHQRYDGLTARFKQQTDGARLPINVVVYIPGNRYSQKYQPTKKQKGRRLLVSPCCVWWPLLDLNQRPSDYENHYQ
ncbi:hypothetical protein [Raoultella terrigena]|uniref:hypothetical protein n=1 Tax=Raoultella terrigena TaxID=577 RepID=UPI0011CDB5BE|nr:hypothetical protein [Raoultella terrigena]